MRPIPIVLALVALTVVSDAVAAQEPTPSDTLPAGEGRVFRAAPLEVEAIAGPLRRFPGSVEVVEVGAAEGARALGSGELLRRAPGIHVQDEDGMGLHVNIGVRGLDPRRSSRVLLLEDGVPIHLAPYGDPSAHYQPPPDAVRRIEVVRGSGQVLHGPQTVGGVINYLRGTPPLTPGATVSLAGGSAGAMLARVNLGGTWADRAAVVSIARRASDGPRDGWRHTVHDALTRADLRAGRHAATLQVVGYQERSDWGEAGLTQAEFEARPFANPSPDDFFELRRIAGRIAVESTLSRAATLRTTVYSQRVHRASWRQAGSSSDRFGSERFAASFRCAADATGVDGCGNQGRPRDYAFAGVEPRLEVAHRVAGVETHSDLGVRYHAESAVRRQYTGSTPVSRSGELTRDNAIRTGALAAFAQTRARLGRWTLTPGARLEHVRSRNTNRLRDESSSERSTRLLPGLAAAWEPAGGTTFFAGVHRGYAPPRPADVLVPGTGQGLVRVDPETSWNTEVGVRTRPVPALAASATLFRIDFRNQVVEASVAGAGQRFVNAGATLHQGAELAATYGGPLTVDVAYTWVARADFRSDLASTVDGETPIRGNRLPYAPRRLLRASVGRRIGAGGEVRVEATHVASQFGDDLETVAPTPDGQRGILPAYTVVGGSATLPFEAWGTELFVAGRNLLDRVYITGRQEGIMVGAPRSVLVGVRWRS